MTTVTTTDLAGLDLVHRGKVRDIYAIPGRDDLLLLVASDRISAYDVVMDTPIPGKGEVLTRLSLFWFDLLGDVVANHLVSADPADYPQACAPHARALAGRSMLVKKARVLPVECIVRGYISGSFWKAYQKSRVVCGFDLPEGMRESDPFPQPLFTPSTKAEQGLHDENISMERMEEIVGPDMARKMAEISVELYTRAAAFARERGIIIADTKFELGLDENGDLMLVDEVLTPDSSRFWPLDQYEPGRGQPSFDKQFLRDYLSSLDWNKEPPPPPLPREIVDKTASRYQEALRILTS